MQGTKVVIWVLAVSLGATALMFGIASLVRASGETGSSDRSVVVSRGSASERSDYVRLCERDAWDDVTDVQLAVSLAERRLSAGLDRLEAERTVGEVAEWTEDMASLVEQIYIVMVLQGRSWREITSVSWPDEWPAPSRRQLAETTESCVRELTDAGRRWIAAAGR